MIAAIRRAISSLTRSIVRKPIILQRADGLDGRPYGCVLVYDRRDPFAVRLIVPSHNTRAAVEIVFARGLLIDGLNRPSGDGAVRVEPHIVDPDYVTLTLPVTSDGVEYFAERAPLQDFVAASCALVPSGRELPQVHHELDRWLAGVTA